MVGSWTVVVGGLETGVSLGCVLVGVGEEQSVSGWCQMVEVRGAWEDFGCPQK